jgi:regulator of sirC expression with transglutaminase-like and TPR domain
MPKDEFTLPSQIPLTEISNLFYELEFSTQETKMKVIRKIASMIPWDYPLGELVDEIKDPTLRLCTRAVFPTINIQRTNHCLKNLSSKGNTNHYDDLEEGVYLLSNMGDIDFTYNRLKSELDRLADRVKELILDHNELYINDDIRVRALIKVMHEEEGYIGNNIDFNNPNNTYLSKVIHKKMGIPISLSVLYLLVAKRVGIQLFGTNMPLHFLLQFESEGKDYYLDAFHGGVILDQATCLKFLESNGFNPSHKYFSKASTLSILKRMYRNLIHIYRSKKQKDMEEILTHQLFILENKSKFTE